MRICLWKTKGRVDLVCKLVGVFQSFRFVVDVIRRQAGFVGEIRLPQSMRSNQLTRTLSSALGKRETGAAL